MNIEQVVGEMPKAENPHHVVYPSESKGYVMANPETLTTQTEKIHDAFEEGSNARAKLLAEQGYRPVPNDPFLCPISVPHLGSTAKAKAFWLGVRAYHRWLLEGE